MHEFVSIQKIGDDRGIRAVREHADLYARERDISGQRIRVERAEWRGSRVHGAHALRGLHGERGDGRDAVAIVRRESFQVGGDARAAGWIKPGDGEKDGRRLSWRDCSTSSALRA